MRILGLPGINPVTEQWMKDLFQALEIGQTVATVQQYQSWQTPGAKLDVETEIARAGQAQADIIIAKSIGTIVALHGYKRGVLPAGRYVFIGTPVTGMGKYEKDRLREFLDGAPQVLFIQQVDDRTGTVNELRKVVVDTASVKIVGVPGSDHMYRDIQQLKNIIELWLQETGA